MKVLSLFLLLAALAYGSGQKLTYSVGWAGPWGPTPISKRVLLERVGAMVTMTVAGPSTLATYATTTTSTILPPSFRPVNKQIFGCIIMNRGEYGWGTLSVGPEGYITIGDLDTGFSYTPDTTVGLGQPSRSQTFTYNTLPFDTSSTVGWTGPWGAPSFNKHASFVRQGSMVTMTLESDHGVFTNYVPGGTYITTTSPIEASFRPQVTQSFKILLRGSMYTWGVLRIGSDGYLRIGTTSGPLPAEWIGTGVGFGHPNTTLTFTYTSRVLGRLGPEKSAWWTGVSSTIIPTGEFTTLEFIGNDRKVDPNGLINWVNSSFTIPQIKQSDGGRYYWIEVQIRMPNRPLVPSLSDTCGVRLKAKRSDETGNRWITYEGESFSHPDDEGRRVCSLQTLVQWTPYLENDYFQIQALHSSGYNLPNGTQIRLSAVWLKQTGDATYWAGYVPQRNGYWFQGSSSMNVPTGYFVPLTYITKQTATYANSTNPVFVNAGEFKLTKPGKYWLSVQVRMADITPAPLAADTCGIRFVVSGVAMNEGFARPDTFGRRSCHIRSVIEITAQKTITIQIIQSTGQSFYSVPFVSLQILDLSEFNANVAGLWYQGNAINPPTNYIGWTNHTGEAKGWTSGVIVNNANIMSQSVNASTWNSNFEVVKPGYYWIECQIRLFDGQSLTINSVGLTFDGVGVTPESYCITDHAGRRVCSLQTLVYWPNTGDVYLRVWQKSVTAGVSMNDIVLQIVYLGSP